MDYRFWTDFADGSVMFPLGVAVPLLLGVFGQRRAALAWMAAIGCVWAAMLVLKLGGYTLAAILPVSPLGYIGLVTPSGHVASASVIYGGLIGLLCSRPGNLTARTALAAILVAIAIGTTRVTLHAHSLSEVIVGAAVGVSGAVALARAAGTAIDARARLPIAAVVLLIITSFHGDHLTWEEAIHDAALRAIRALGAQS